jgi:outer membrane receptor for ferrienterochelin and colicins
MKKYIMIFISMLSACFTIFSQNGTDANIFGHVIDKTTKKHIPYITINLKGTTIGTATDLSGHYYLKNLPEGEHVLVASGMGYKTVEQPVELRRDETLEINFEMEEDPIMLGTVVVSANRTETKRKEAPVIVNVITPLLFENTNSVTLAQGLNFQPGLRVETNCQNCGFQQVRINGLDGPYSQILIDSRPVFSALAGVYGIEQIPANMIERVEVLRGGGSALFGSNAIAGTINIITKEPKSNSLSVSNTTNLIGGNTADNNLSLNASLVSQDMKAGVVLFGASRDRGGFDHDSDGFTEIAKLNSVNLGLKAYYNVNLHNKFTMEYHTINEFRRGGNLLDEPPHETDITEQTEHNIHSGNIGYDFSSTDYKHKLSIYFSGQLIDRKSYYGAQRDLNAYGDTDDNTFVQGIQYHFVMDTLLFMPAQLTLGQEYNYNKMTDRMPGYDRLLNQKVNTKSLFLQNEWKNTNLSILLGGRLDKHNLIKDAIFSPRLNVRYSPTPFIGLRAGYSTGFRAPQAFEEKKFTFEEAATFLSDDKDTRNNKGIMVNSNRQSNYYGTSRFQLDELNQDIANVIGNMKVGEISDPFIMLNKNGKQVAAIVKVTNRIEGHKANLNNDYQIIKTLAENARRQEMIDQWLREKIKNTYVRIDPAWKNCDFKYPGWIK